MRYQELLENTAMIEDAEPQMTAQASAPASKLYFHVTTKQRLRSIQANGLEPNHKRRWKTGFGKQLGDRGYIYLMSDFTAAVRWAHKMEWEHFGGKAPEKSPYIILCVRENPEALERDPHPESGLYGNSWFQKKGRIAPDDIVKVIPLTHDLIQQVVDGGTAMHEGLGGMTSLWSQSKCIRMLQSRGWEPTTIPDNFQNVEYPEFSIDLNIHSPDPRGPFTVLKGGKRLAVTKEPPYAQQLGLRAKLI